MNNNSIRLAWYRFFALAALVVVLDQASKAYVVLHLTDARAPSLSGAAPSASDAFLWTKHPLATPPKAIVRNFFHLRYIENPGAAWGLLSRHDSAWRTPLFLGISLASMILVPLYFRTSKPEQKSLRWALGLVLGGAIGNFLDRVRLGYVIDFIDWHIYERYTWPTFNIADAAITIGALLMILDTLRTPVPGHKQPSSSLSES